MINQLQAAKGKLDSFFKNAFVELIDPENRATGRSVYISKDENKFYIKIINQRSKDFNSYYIYKQIVSLKNMGYINSMMSKITMNSRMLPIEGGQIHYHVWQSKVYITEIQVQKNYRLTPHGRDVPAGVYQIKKTDETIAWKPEGFENKTIKPQRVVNTKNLAINGHCDDISNAANYMPNFITYGYGEGALNQSYALFFNPSQGGVGAEWRAFKNSAGVGGGTQAAKKLASALILSAEKNINITVQGDGHSLFKQALKVVAQSNHSLEKMTVFYANATENLSLVEHWRKKTKMKLAQKAPLINNLNIRQSISSGNFVSQPLVASQANSSNNLSIATGAAMNAFALVGLGSIGGGLVGAAGWALGVAPLLLGQSKAMNKKVIESPQQALQEGAKHYKKLIWDPVHKMMVKS